MNKKLKATMLVAAVAAAGFGSYKAYNAYQVSNMSDAELLVVENLSALSDPGTMIGESSNKKTKKIKVVDKTGGCYRIERSNIQPVFDHYNNYIGESCIVRCTQEGRWQTCKKVKTEDEDAFDQCEKIECEYGLSKTSVMDGLHYSWEGIY